MDEQIKSIENLDLLLRLVHPEWCPLLEDWAIANFASRLPSSTLKIDDCRWWYENVTNLAKYSDNPTVKEALQVCFRANLFIV